MGALDLKTMEDIVSRVTRELRAALGAAGAAGAGAGQGTPGRLPEALGSLRAAGTQPEVLRALLRAVTAFGARSALFVVRGDHLEGWEGVGFDDDPAIAGVLRGIQLPRQQPALQTLFEETRTVHAEMRGPFAVPDFGQTIRGEAMLLPIVVQDKIAGVLYADPASGTEPFDRHAVEVLAEHAGLVVERLVLARALQAAGGQETGPQRPAAAPPARPAAPPAPPAPAPAPAFAPPPAFSAPPAFQPMRPAPEPAPAPAPRPAPRPEPIVAPPAAERAASARIERPTIWPGLGDEMTPEAEIEDARRYARLLMEEIILYHGAKVNEGRGQGDLQDRLADELHQARQMYDRRIEARVRAGGNYFEEAMLRILANGDPRALGTPA